MVLVDNVMMDEGMSAEVLDGNHRHYLGRDEWTKLKSSVDI
jgi:hypothetical protein